MDKFLHPHSFFIRWSHSFIVGGRGARHRNGMHILAAFTICMAREQKKVFFSELKSDAAGIVLGSNLENML